MKTTTLPKSALESFVSLLGRFGEVHAPVARAGGFVFDRLTNWADARLDYTRTLLPPKKYLLPPRESLFRFDAESGYVAESEDAAKRIVLFGVHPCDVYGLNILDDVYGARSKFPDPYFRTRRRSVVIVGVDCTPDEHCFCRSMRADFVDHGFDLFLYDIGDDFLVLVGTALGDDIILAGRALFRDVTAADIAEYKHRSTMKREMFRRSVEIRDLPEIFEIEYESGLWESIGEKCLSCGICTSVCPTCYCYELRDVVEAARCAGERTRCWDSCVFHTHALVAGGENFRESRADRIKFRFYHKQRGFVAEYGRPSCVGCGRCTVACPVGIDIIDVIDRLRGARDASQPVGA
ncbi:MAG TPA: 4Fe-4S dicluster domain-containing protein [Gemmatimonadaceae bacterium]|nr:4Fe-4S dicluster domain-containing protein [Gemmatimonadaceae bacterium]